MYPAFRVGTHRLNYKKGNKVCVSFVPLIFLSFCPVEHVFISDHNLIMDERYVLCGEVVCKFIRPQFLVRISISRIWLSSRSVRSIARNSWCHNSSSSLYLPLLLSVLRCHMCIITRKDLHLESATDTSRPI
jgi:hypothetical protein